MCRYVNQNTTSHVYLGQVLYKFELRMITRQPTTFVQREVGKKKMGYVLKYWCLSKRKKKKKKKTIKQNNKKINEWLRILIVEKAVKICP